MTTAPEALHKQIENLERNLQLIQERKTEFVLPSEIPLQLIRDERETQQRLAELHRQLMELERSSGHSASVTFIAGPPITHPRHFFGRTRELRRLFGLWQQAPLQNAAIIGPRRSGKTSLLNYLRTITAAGIAPGSGPRLAARAAELSLDLRGFPGSARGHASRISAPSAGWAGSPRARAVRSGPLHGPGQPAPAQSHRRAAG